MAFSEQEKQIILYGKSQGKSREEIEGAIGRLRSGVQPTPPQKPEPSLLEKTADRGEGFVKGLLESSIGTARLLQSGGQRIVAGIDPTKNLQEVRAQTGFKSLQGADAQMIDEMLDSKSDEERQGKLAAFGAEVLLGGGANLIRKGAVGTAKLVAGGANRLAGVAEEGLRVADRAIQSPTAQGIIQQGKEFAERFPRGVEKIKEGTQEALERGQRIKTSTPEVGNAIKSGLDERYINTVQQANPPTLKGYKEMVDIAEDSTATKGATLKPKQRPEIVAGRASEAQYDLIEKQRKNIGGQIGEVVDALSKKTKIDVNPSYRTMRDVLRKNGVNPVQGGKLEFTGKFTPTERTAIQKLYELSLEGGEQLTPRQIYDMDRLFSKLQREARFEGVGDILVDVDDGTKSLYRVFRDIFSEQLDSISPELRGLNRQYRQIATLQDDIENSIVKSGKFESTKDVDTAEFAKTNLRRITSDALSSADYQAIARKMDEFSRSLGYKDASPEDLIVFANELRKLYPETIPQTSFSGGIKTGITDILEKISDLGAPTTKDKQKALKGLIDSLMKGSPQK